MSYRNPEIITDKSGEILAQGFASFGQSMAKGVATAIEKADQIKKQRAADTLRMNKLDTDIKIQNAKKAAEFKSNLPKTSLNTKLNSIIDERIKAAGDAQMALYNESDPETRNALLKTIQNTDSFLTNSGTFLEDLKAEIAFFRERKNGGLNKYWAINGVDEKDRVNKFGLLSLLSGETTGNIDLQFDLESNSLNLNAYGNIGEEGWSVNGFNSNNYLASGSELFYEISQMVENTIKASTKIITNPQGELLPNVTNAPVTKRIYQDIVDEDTKKIGRKLVEGQIEEINQSVIDNLIGKEISSSVAGFNAASPLDQNAIFLYELDAPYKSYTDFLEKVKDPVEQDKIISQMFKEKTIEGIGEQFESYEKDGQKVYFRSVTPLKEVKPEKPETPSAADNKAAELQKTASNYYDQFIANPVDFLGTTAAFSELLNYDGNIIQLNLSKPGENPNFKAFDPTEPQGRKLLFDYWIDNSRLGQPLKDKLKEINLKNKGNIIPKEDEYYGK